MSMRSQTRRCRSTRRRQDTPDLPRVPMDQRTTGRTFTAPDGREYRPSMFVTLTLPSYGKVRDGIPVDPESYDYRRAALDALLFPRLLDRFWQNLRRCAGYRVQYFSAVEAQRRLAPHLHAAIRGAIPRATLKAVVRATYHQVWWPPVEDPVYVQRVPVWDAAVEGYIDPDTGQVLPTWGQALDELDSRPGRGAGACAAVRLPAGHQGPARRQCGCGPGGALPVQVPDQGHRRHLQPRPSTGRPGV